MTTQQQGPYNSALETIFIACTNLQLKQLRKEIVTNDISCILKDVVRQVNDFMFNLMTGAGLVNQSSCKKRQYQDENGGFGARAIR